MRIWMAQINPHLGDVEKNLIRVQDAINRVAVQGERGLIVFPELSLTGYNLRDTWQDHSTTLEYLRQRIVCPSHVSAVVGFSEASSDGIFNSAALIRSEAEIFNQRKIYPVSYPPFDEDKHFKRGSDLNSFSIDGFHATILICNDAWHPTLPYLAALKGANLLIIPTNSSRFGTNISAWPTLIRYYAIIYGCYVVFVNRVGSEGNKWNFWGGSEVISPTGESLLLAGGSEEVRHVDIWPEAVQDAREKLPIMNEEDPLFTYKLLGEQVKIRNS